MIKHVFLLSKPGIIVGNIITMLAGFFLASKTYDFMLLATTIFGLSSIIAAACICNNIIDKQSDAIMQRTKNRPLVQGVISEKAALAFAFTLLTIGASLLFYFTNHSAFIFALLGFIIYVFAYSYLKHRSEHATLVGSIAGAMPPCVGYLAVSNAIDPGCVILFLIVTFWQMPHFFAIALRRKAEYAAAGIPVLPVKRGNEATKIQSLYYLFAFAVVSLLPTLYGITGSIYFTCALIVSLYWLKIGFEGLTCSDDKEWAKKMFLFSLVVIFVLSFALAFL